MLRLFMLLLFASSGLVWAQETKTVPFATLEQVPVYPGCKGDSADLKACMSKSINKFVNQNFDMELVRNLGLPEGRHRLVAQFQISTEGTIENILIRGDYLQVNQELERVVNLIPNMEPGYVDGEAVQVTYALPVLFAIAPDPDKKKKKRKKKNS
jgi:protein TonB